MKITAVTDINPEPLVIPKIYFFRYFASCIRIVFGRRKNENMSKNLKKLLQLYTEISYSSTLTPLQFSCTLNSLSTTNMDDIVFRTVGEYVFQSFI